MTKEKLFKKSYSLELQRIARGDLESAEGMRESGRGRPENVCYMAQQAIEKSLKALICHCEMPIPFTHSIELLIDRLPQDKRPRDVELLVELTDYAMLKRYNEGSEILTQSDLIATIEAANRLLTQVDASLGE